MKKKRLSNIDMYAEYCQSIFYVNFTKDAPIIKIFKNGPCQEKKYIVSSRRQLCKRNNMAV